MADSEVRQKFEATVKGICEILNEWRRGTGPGIATLLMMAWDEAFEAGMRAGEIAMQEKLIKALCVGCRMGWPEQGRPGHGIVIHVPPEPHGLYACQAVAIRALPAAPEEKKS